MASDGCQMQPGQGEHVGKTLGNRNNLHITCHTRKAVEQPKWFLLVASALMGNARGGSEVQ